MIDVLIVGGGPAGLVTALYARRAGLSAAIVERRGAPIDKACGEGLMPPAVAALDELGVHPLGMPLRGIRYAQGSRQAEASFPGRCGLGVRRTELYAALHAAAVGAGVRLVRGSVDAVTQDGESASAAGLRARYLVGADGLHSTVRRVVAAVAPPPAASGRRRWGMRAHFPCAPWTDHVEVHWSAGGEAYVTPLSADCVGVALLGGRGASFPERLARHPALAERLAGARPGPVMAAGPMRQDVDRRVRGRVLLVGDAAGYVDALTGEGLALAFESGRAAITRIAAGEPARYEADYRALSRQRQWLTRALLAASARPALRSRIVPAAAGAPWLFHAAVRQLAR